MVAEVDHTPTWRRRVLHAVTWLVVGLVVLIVTGIAISAGFHWWQTPRDKRAVEQAIGSDHRYVDVAGHRLSVAVQGSGPRTVVLLPGFGTTEPILDFAPLADRLAEQNTVVTVEYFGLGLSDETDTPRTSEAVVGEVRSALGSLGLDGPYVLMPHSISGLYTMWWVQHRPDEIAAVVGLDDERYAGSQVEDSPSWPSWMSVVTAVGGVRDLINLDIRTDYLGLVADYRESLGDADEYTAEQQDLYIRANSWVLNSTVLREAAEESNNMRAVEHATFPPTMPALSILASTSLEVEPEWKEVHDAAVTNPAIQQVTVIEGHHYLFRAHASSMAESIQGFLDEHVPSG
ncbi:pimeloyl-ACP methyl ester carboxylesterase [Rhodococcus sp. 27YEA15]|uniref:alpha/beta fold hydrolase n=1 Tax=Rhodococcus sp. 27YEA15 TaxID=3156259 RepID=UPI003C7C12CB